MEGGETRRGAFVAVQNENNGRKGRASCEILRSTPVTCYPAAHTASTAEKLMSRDRVKFTQNFRGLRDSGEAAEWTTDSYFPPPVNRRKRFS